MILFAQKYHDAIRAGKITFTFRNWNTLKLQKNKIYKSYNLGLLRIIDVRFRKLADITADEIKKCGYTSLKKFRDEYQENSRSDVDFTTDSAVKIEFEYAGQDIEDKKRLMGKVSLMELIEIKRKISLMDEKSPTPWIFKALRLLGRKGAMFSKDLEKSLKIPSDKIKQTMRKLKELNLIHSNSSKGYSVTPLSLKLINFIDKKR